MKNAENWIIPGDWVIRSTPPTEKYEDSYSFLAPPSRRQREEEEKADAFTDHAVFVMGITKSHMTLFEPLIGRPVIVQLHEFDGTWHYATEDQVEVTWEVAMSIRDRAQAAHAIPMEKAKYKYRRRGAPGREINAPFRILGEGE